MSLGDDTETDQTKLNPNTSMPTQSYNAIHVGHVNIAGTSSACIPRLNLSRNDEFNEGCEQEIVAKQRLRVDQFLTVILQVCFNPKLIILYISFY